MNWISINISIEFIEKILERLLISLTLTLKLLPKIPVTIPVSKVTNNVWATNWFFKLKIHNPLCFRNILFASDIFSLLQRYILIASAIYPLRLKHLSTFHLNFRISLCHSAEIRLHPRKSDLATFLRTYKSLLSVNAINEHFCLPSISSVFA